VVIVTMRIIKSSQLKKNLELNYVGLGGFEEPIALVSRNKKMLR
jgi:hypothetical protein